MKTAVATILALFLASSSMAEEMKVSQLDLPSLINEETQPAEAEDKETAPQAERPRPPAAEEEPAEEAEEEPSKAPTAVEMPEEPEEELEEEFAPEPLAEEPKEKTAGGPKKISIDTIIYVDYQFFGSSDAFKVKYHLNMGGSANVAAAVINGNAEIATEVTGYLAKWPQGQCALDVSIAKVPYEIGYKQSSENEADITVRFKKDISEKWESTCTYIDGVTKPFKTEGPPEKWIEAALGKTSPPLSSLVTPLEAGETSSTTFDIAEYTVVEENLGNAKVKGTGVVTIEPAVPELKGEGAKTQRSGTSAPTSQFKPPAPTAPGREMVKRGE